MPASFHYRLFDLHIRSDLELPELTAAEPVEAVDIDISLGPIADPIEGDDYRVGENGAGVAIDGVARYWISRGREIVIQQEADSDPRNVRLYLLGSAMGALLHQRGLLPLHGNAVEINGSAFIFIGPSGAGKSTLAAAFHDRGLQVLADDVAVIGFDDRRGAVVRPGISRLRLWEQSLRASGRDAKDYEQSYSGDASFRKFDVPIASQLHSRPLGAIYLLADGAAFAITQIEGAAAVQALFANTYRGAFVPAGGRPLAHWQAVVQLLGRVPVFELIRPKDLARVCDDLEQIVAHAKQFAGC